MVKERVKRENFTIIRPRYRRSEIESKSSDRCFKEPPPPNWIKMNKYQISNKETNDRTTTKNPRATEGECYCNINNFNGGSNRNNNPSSSSSSRIAVARIAKHETLDLVRCQSCETYMMLKPEADVCPICNGGLVLFERERCFYYND